MPGPFQFERSLAFTPESAAETLRTIPALPGVLALFGHSADAQPYLTRAADLRRRVTRMLAPPEVSADGTTPHSKRLNLRDRVARIEYTVTGSEFESTLTLYHASVAIFGVDEARRRLKLRTPYFLRFAVENAFPRVYSTNRLSKRSLQNFYGPFPSRTAADRYCDAVLDLFKLRRCHEELAPYPEHPGCIYGEMNKCLAPCNRAHTPEGAAAYSAEAAAVHEFFETHGRSMLDKLTAAREQASADMEFERAAEIHAQHQKVKAAADLADELVQPIPRLRAVIVQKAAKDTAAEAAASDEPEASVFLLQSGCIAGPARLSTLGVRAVKEQTSVGSSLFAQPLMLQAVPLEDSATAPAEAPAEPAVTPTLNPEARATGVIAELEEHASAPADLATLSDHLSLLRRWYYRPEKHRAGEIFFPKEDGAWPVRRILNGAARAALGDAKHMAETQRDLAQRNPADAEQKPARTKVLHAGRPDVEREVPVLERVPTRRKK
ncbi:MAG TPA: excinuclease ABC subunit C [Acidobacteriaceae bacterium]|nr:excinuclease ABC subunit C [Acidobacteriaceae bacterium]